MEMAHDARIIPLDGRSHLNEDVRQWLGDSRGYWDGDTLVVETKNYSQQANFMGAAEHLQVTERFTRASQGVLEYEVTLNDSTTWEKPWTAMIRIVVPRTRVMPPRVVSMTRRVTTETPAPPTRVTQRAAASTSRTPRRATIKTPVLQATFASRAFAWAVAR